MNFLKNHPFAVKAFFENSTVLTFAVAKEELLSLIPYPLQLDTFQDKWAFIAIAMVQTKSLRPAIFPSFLGNNFFLIGYRIFVRFKNNKGKNLRGLYILKSETDKKKMELLGSIFTRYNYGTTDITKTLTENKRIFSSDKSAFKIEINLEKEDVNIPSSSPFDDWKDARRFAGPLPHTFTVDSKNKTILIIRGLRQNWKPKAIQVTSYNFEFLNNFKFNEIRLASAFEIEKIPYKWEKGKIESWI